MPKENCPFLNISGTIRSPQQDDPSTQLMESEILGDYRASQEALFLVRDYKKERNVKSLNLTQGLINCANRILVANELNNLPYLVCAAEYSRFKNNLELIQKHRSKTIELINVEDVLKEKVDHTLKSDALLLQFATKLEDRQAFSYFKVSIQDMVIAKISGNEEFAVIINHLAEEKLIDESTVLNALNPSFEPEEQSPFGDEYRFTIKGWKHIQVEKEKINTNKVFIATSFKWAEDDETRVQVVESIKRACDRLGWKADIVSQSHTDYITDRIMSEIRSSKFVVAELTYHNRGVYFESGFARGLGKNVFHIVKDGFNQTLPEADKENKRIHFDIQQVQYRTWNCPKEAEDKLYDWINSTFGEYKP